MSRTHAGFWNRMAARYARQPVADDAAYQHTLAMTHEHLHPEMTWLAFGCGTGSTALLHSLRSAGFDVEYEWQPGPDKAVFLVARKPGE